MSKPKIKRSEEREFAFKMFYAAEFNDIPFRQQIKQLEKKDQIMATEYVVKIISVCGDHNSEFDEIIKDNLKNWEISRIAVIDKLILRMAIAELYYFDQIPPEVSINEAIEVAKKFSTELSGKFINGVLDAIYQKNKKRSIHEPKKKEYPRTKSSI